MKRIADSVCIVDEKCTNGDTYAVCASELAEFDESNSTLAVTLDSFVRKVNLRSRDTCFHPSWLPPHQEVRCHISREEAGDEAGAIFGNWTHKVKETIPGLAEFHDTLLSALSQPQIESKV